MWLKYRAINPEHGWSRGFDPPGTKILGQPLTMRQSFLEKNIYSSFIFKLIVLILSRRLIIYEENH